MVCNDMCNDILLKAYKNYLNDIQIHKIEIPLNSYQKLCNEALNYLNENELIAISARTIDFAKFYLTTLGISYASTL